VEEPLLLGQYAHRIPPERFEHRVLQRLYATLVERREGLLQPTDVRVLFSEDDEASTVLSAISGAERSVTVRFVDSDARRAYLDRVVERFEVADLQCRYREVDSLINRLVEAGASIPRDVRDEYAALAAKLKG
jgi:hypothetical protein